MRASLAAMGLKVIKATKGHRDRRAKRATLATKARPVHPAILAQMARPDRKAIPAQRDPQVPRDQRGRLALLTLIKPMWTRRTLNGYCCQAG